MQIQAFRIGYFKSDMTHKCAQFKSLILKYYQFYFEYFA